MPKGIRLTLEQFAKVRRSDVDQNRTQNPRAAHHGRIARAGGLYSESSAEIFYRRSRETVAESVARTELSALTRLCQSRSCGARTQTMNILNLPNNGENFNPTPALC